MSAADSSGQIHLVDPDQYSSPLWKDFATFNNAIYETHLEELGTRGPGLRRANALDEFITARNGVEIDKAINMIHKAFGAPGDYGYGTTAGDAFLALLNAKSEDIKTLDIELAQAN